MRNYLSLLILLFFISLTSCRTDFDFEPSVGNLEFSKDTVYLDTVFTNIGSSTYTLKVYNRSNKNISIPTLKLGQGEASKYRLMVDGMPGKVFNNIEMLAKDSLYIFIETTIDYDDYSNPNSNFLYTDVIQFGTETNFQKVDLVTLVQDAYFIYPDRSGSPNNYTYEQINIGLDENNQPITINGSNLDENDPKNGNELHWTNQKPYVVYGYAKIPENKTLTVDAGARIHFHANSGLIVSDNASLKINGSPSNTNDLENEVIFESDRLEPGFAEVPGQWGTIWFFPNSLNNELKNVTIKNATVGLLVSGNPNMINPNIDLYNVQIYNCSNLGIFARTGNMVGKNVVINKCGQFSFAGTFGGSYEFTHSTFANYWSTPNQSSVYLNNFLKVSNSQIDTLPLTKAIFNNSILYGSTNLALKLEKSSETTFNYNFNNCLIKFIDSNNQYTSNDLYKFSTNPNYQSCIIATSSTTNKPDFLNPNNNKLNIGANSIAKGNANFANSNFPDIRNQNRTVPSDIGAYNWITFD